MLLSGERYPRNANLVPSSSGLGHRPFTAKTRVQISLGSPLPSQLNRSDGIAESLRCWRADFQQKQKRTHTEWFTRQTVCRSYSRERRGRRSVLSCLPLRNKGRLRYAGVAEWHRRVPQEHKFVGSSPSTCTNLLVKIKKLTFYKNYDIIIIES